MNAKLWIKRILGVTALAAAGVAIGVPAQAGTATSTFIVQTTVYGPCTFTTSTLTFPNYTLGTTTSVTGSTNFTVTCPAATAVNPINVTLAFNGSTNPGAFQMSQTAGSAPYLTYDLCQDSTCASLYAYNTAGAGIPITTNAGQSVPVYGEIPASQNPAIPSGTLVQQTDNAILTF